MNYKIAQFILTPPKRGQSSLEIYVAQPDANKEALAGKIFALLEIESAKAENLKIINFLINTLNHNYYQNEKMILRERVSSIKIEHIFESALAKTNKKLAEFLTAEKIKLNPDLLNITIGVVYNDSLHYSSLGKNKAFLIYKTKTETASKFKLADITEQTSGHETKKPTSPVKLFANVISGALPRGGYFIFSNETLGEYLSAKQLIDIVTTLPPVSAAEQIKNTLGKINAYVPFMGLIIKNTAGLEIAEIKIKEPTPTTSSSITNLITTEETTEKLLTPSGLVGTKKWLGLFGTLTGRFGFSGSGRVGAKTFSLKDKVFAKRNTGWQALAKFFSLLKNLLVWLLGLLVYIFKIITDKKTLKETFTRLAMFIENIWPALKTSVEKSRFWFSSLNSLNKILFTAFLLCLLVFSANLGWQNYNNNNLDKQTALNNLIAAIEQKQNQIDASLLYNNEEGAKKILAEVAVMMKELPIDNPAQADSFNGLLAKNQVQLEKISRVIQVDAVELANFKNLNPNAEPLNLALVNKEVFAADPSQKTIYSLDLSSKLSTAIGLDGTIKNLNFPNPDKNNNLYYLNVDKVLVLNTATKKTSSLEIALPAAATKAFDFKQYNNRFYLADRAAGQIYRFTKSGDQLASAVAWLNSQEDMAEATSLDIDGSVYLLKKNGEVIKFAKGQKEDFNLSLVEPAITQAKKIIASADLAYLYLLEPAAGRLIVFDKTGKFINQYKSDRLVNSKDLQIDEKNKMAYFLIDATLYSFALGHLK